MNVSIIIVNYNTVNLLDNCLSSIYSQTKDITFEIIVSDNGSTDNSIKMIKEKYPKVIVIENNENLGFGAANNKGLAIAKGDYILYLNSDTVLLNNAIKYFFDYFEKNNKDNKLGILGSILLDENFKPSYSYDNLPKFRDIEKELIKMFFINIILSFSYLLHIPIEKLRSRIKKDIEIDYEKLKDVEFISGADLFLKNTPLAKFDESFFLYYEDTKLNYDFQKKGYIRRIIEGPKIQHLCGGSVGESYTIKRKASFSRIQYEISRVKWIKTLYPNDKFKLFLVRLQISVLWINPLLFSKTKNYFKAIWK